MTASSRPTLRVAGPLFTVTAVQRAYPYLETSRQWAPFDPATDTDDLDAWLAEAYPAEDEGEAGSSACVLFDELSEWAQTDPDLGQEGEFRLGDLRVTAVRSA
jgi:hypothetical protein